MSLDSTDLLLVQDTVTNTLHKITFANLSQDVKGAIDYDTRYILETGDDMTGDLTLGTDKITLNATDGSAKFGGGIDVSSSSTEGMAIGSNGKLTIQRINGAGQLFVGYNETVKTVEIDVDGSAEFAGPLEVSNPTNAITKVVNTTNGFTGVFNASSSSVNLGTTSGAALLTFSQNDVNSAALDVSGNFLVGGTLPSAPNITLNADGSAIFTGEVDAASMDCGTY